jgi:hypothetical protein
MTLKSTCLLLAAAGLALLLPADRLIVAAFDADTPALGQAFARAGDGRGGHHGGHHGGGHGGGHSHHGHGNHGGGKGGGKGGGTGGDGGTDGGSGGSEVPDAAPELENGPGGDGGASAGPDRGSTTGRADFATSSADRLGELETLDPCAYLFSYFSTCER